MPDEACTHAHHVIPTRADQCPRCSGTMTQPVDETVPPEMEELPIEMNDRGYRALYQVLRYMHDVSPDGIDPVATATSLCAAWCGPHRAPRTEPVRFAMTQPLVDERLARTLAEAWSSALSEFARVVRYWPGDESQALAARLDVEAAGFLVAARGK